MSGLCILFELHPNLHTAISIELKWQLGSPLFPWCKEFSLGEDGCC